jgi:hypothetical protein
MFYAKFIIYDEALDNFSVGGRGQEQKSKIERYQGYFYVLIRF